MCRYNRCRKSFPHSPHTTTCTIRFGESENIHTAQGREFDRAQKNLESFANPHTSAALSPCLDAIGRRSFHDAGHRTSRAETGDPSPNNSALNPTPNETAFYSRNTSDS